MVSDSDFNVGRFLLFPGRRLCGLLFKLEPRRGILEELSDISFKAGAVELYVNFSMPFTGESIMSGVVFLDSTNMNISVDDLAEKMRSVSGVKSIKIIKPTVEGLIADYMNHRLMLAGERAIIIRRSIYAGISKRMREQFGTAGEAFLFHLGHNAGMEYGKSHLEMAKKLGISDPAEIIKSVNLPLFSAVGFGRPEIIEITTHPSFKAIVRVYDCFECETGMESKKPYSQFTRGMLAGYLSSLLNKRVLVEETECIAKGDPYCELTATQV
ncbi:MAG: V4R domain-containing protein [Candidatus Bathyarchaeia archaeon]